MAAEKVASAGQERGKLMPLLPQYAKVGIEDVKDILF